MYDMDTRTEALRLVAAGRSLNSVSKETGISRSAIRGWQTRIEPRGRMLAAPWAPPADRAAYAYLLGLYLGDGHIGKHRSRDGQYLRISCSDAYPGLIEQCREAIRAVSPLSKVCLVQHQGCVNVTSYGYHWSRYFPQHGPGKKHERRIALEPWQQEIVDEQPWAFVRGLIHSDGCRMTNWTVRNGKRYEYPRYWFTNVSDDIRKLFTDTLDRLGVVWTNCARQGKPYNVSVARKASVALLDAHVGPKH
ncbi:helix-turn-helix domain-containing protein [Streptomyces sp. WAC06614]|uniref:helix-turn-helix domain-containing protein n=1 Tax=Streptomyces sp. WAC06614 TaxID=2487416 RepID=UPI000F7719DD|nr:helix-turn-helix domain-containing protein [Streptomyces sp. WAC06614]RSS78544.1 helix-turn-helix domain-containing protein [Streptomyces sp. WAC06614]